MTEIVGYDKCPECGNDRPINAVHDGDDHPDFWANCKDCGEGEWVEDPVVVEVANHSDGRKIKKQRGDVKPWRHNG